MRLWVLVCLMMLSGCSLFREDTLEQVVANRNVAAGSKEQQRQVLKEHYELGEQYYKQGKLTLAAAEFETVLSLRPGDENALYRLGNIAFKEGELEKSAALFEQVISVNPRNGKAQYNLATIRLIQAQNHFKYYAALAGKGVDLTKVSSLLGDIDKFSSQPDVSQDQNSLDRITGAIKNR